MVIQREGTMINIRVDDVIYDTVFCTAFMSYDRGKKKIEDAYLVSNLSYTKQSLLKWNDWGQYGACDHTCEAWDLPTLAECIKDKDWIWNIQNSNRNIERKEGDIVSQALKEEVLKAMSGKL